MTYLHSSRITGMFSTALHTGCPGGAVVRVHALVLAATGSNLARSQGYCFRSISVFVCMYLCIFVSLSARLRENGWTDLHEIFREGVE